MKTMAFENEYMKRYYSEGNKGGTMIPSCVDRCLFLSVGAKKVYSNLSQFCYGNKRECHPSQQRIAFELGMTVRTIGDYVDELREKGVILTFHNNKNGTLNYVFRTVDKVPVLLHSEIVWKILDSIDKRELDFKRIQSIVKKYKQSELCKKIEVSGDPLQYKEEICKYFLENLKELRFSMQEQKGLQLSDKDCACEWEALTFYFYEKYKEQKGEEMVFDIEKHVKYIEEMYKVFKRCGYEVDEVKRRIDIFINSNEIRSCSISTFCDDGIQGMLQKAVNEKKEYLSMDFKKEAGHSDTSNRSTSCEVLDILNKSNREAIF